VAGQLIKSTTFFLTLLVGVSISLPPVVRGQDTQVQTSRLLADSDYFPALLAGVRDAQRSIDLVMYLWKITKSPKNKPRQLVRALGEAHRRGVRVRVLLEDSGYGREINQANRETALLLEQEGIKVIFDSQAVTTHAKMVIIDGRLTYLGSHNLTQSAMGRNRELSLLVDDPALAARLTAYLDHLAAP
jgi:phosphatidylserine/phosphatidylglycerophosphate/cardiolipin synthase-like enzyme